MRLIPRARELRAHSTDAETLLWRYLRRRRLDGFKFRRQQPVGGYILDFLCAEAGLAVEVDGGGHAMTAQAAYDKSRDDRLAREGIRMLRFWNGDVLTNILGVLEVIRAALRPETG